MEKLKLRAALYLRVSTNDKGQTVENQRIPLRKMADERGYKIVREYSEYTTASGRKERKEFKRMMDEAKEGAFDVLLFWSLDRFSREGVVRTMLDLDKLNKEGVEWVSHREELLDTLRLGPMKDVVVALLSALAQMETQRKSERARAAVERLKAQGKAYGGRPKIPMPEATLRDLYRKGYSLPSIARQLGVGKNTVSKWVRELELTREV